ncbi:MAG: hypothetical protein ACYTAS_20800, partial [Planctomycetota bacterium]
MSAGNDDILSALAKMKEKYSLTTRDEGDRIHLHVTGIREDFRLTVSMQDRVLVGDTWHIHLDKPPGTTLESLLEGLFSGAIHIVVKYRGDKPVGQRVKVVQEKGPSYVSWTGAL